MILGRGVNLMCPLKGLISPVSGLQSMTEEWTGVLCSYVECIAGLRLRPFM